MHGLSVALGMEESIPYGCYCSFYRIIMGAVGDWGCYCVLELVGGVIAF